MTEAEWLASDDPVVMLEGLCTAWRGEEADLVRLTHRYVLACCRAVWPLLPMEESRRGVEVAERYIEGRATLEEFALAEHQAEGAAMYLEPDEHDTIDEYPSVRDAKDPTVRDACIRYYAEREARIGLLAKEVEAIPAEELLRLVRLKPGGATISPQRLLMDAAYFAYFAMDHAEVRPREGAVDERYRKFLSATLLRQIVGDPFLRQQPGSKRFV